VYYFIMEYVNGPTLAKIIKEQGVIEEENALKIALQVASALAHAHKNGIVHRDIKPGNIMLDEEGNVKLCDLGLAKVSKHMSITRVGLALGSPNYISPEQAKGDRLIDGRTDIYSLGATLFRIVTGKPPFVGSGTQILHKHIAELPPNPKTLNPQLSDYTASIIMKMMEKKRAKRYQKAEELIADLETALDNLKKNKKLVVAPPRVKSNIPKGRIGKRIKGLTEKKKRPQSDEKPPRIKPKIVAPPPMLAKKSAPANFDEEDETIFANPKKNKVRSPHPAKKESDWNMRTIKLSASDEIIKIRKHPKQKDDNNEADEKDNADENNDVNLS